MKRLHALRGGTAGAMLVALLLAGCTSDPAPASGEESPSVGVGSVPTPTESAPITPDDPAKADLERLVRDYYAAENAVFLDPTSDPSAALDPYLRNPASAARVADVLSFRNAGHTLESSTAEVHSVTVTELDLGSEPASATIEECHTLAATGTDGETGQPASFENRRATTWLASRTASDTGWRLAEYDTGGVGSC